MANPMTTSVRAAIDDATPTLAGTAASISDLLKLLFDEQSAFSTIIESQELFAWNPATSSGLIFGFRGGRVGYGKGGAPTEVAASTVTLTNSATNYIEFNPATGTVVANTSAFTAGRLPLYIVVTSGGTFNSSTVTDMRTPFVILYGKVITANELDNAIGHLLNQITFTIGDEVGNARDVTINVKTLESTPAAIATRRVLEVWLADSATGWETAGVPDGGLSVVTGLAMDVRTADARIRVMTDENGVAVVRLTESSTATWYVRVKIGTQVFTSSAVSFT